MGKKQSKPSYENNPTNMLLGCKKGHLYDYSIQNRKIVKQYETLNGHITSLCKLPDRTNFFAATWDNYNRTSQLYEFDNKRHKTIKTFANSGTTRMVLTNNGKYLITTQHDKRYSLSIILARNSKVVSNSLLTNMENVFSLKCC